MKAVVFDRHGAPDVLRIAEVPDPMPGPGQVRVRVHAAGVQPFDVGVRRGQMPRVSAAFPQRIGQEYSGVVDQVGEGVIGLDVGTAVLGSTMLNGCAELLVVDAATVVVKPPELDFSQAAALVAAAQTASGALAELGVGPGDVLLLHAAAGSVGTLATQLARRINTASNQPAAPKSSSPANSQPAAPKSSSHTVVIGTASPANHDYLRKLGAIPVAYGEGLVGAVRALNLTVTVALDAAGGEAIAQSIALGVDPQRVGTIVDDAAAKRHGARTVRAPRSPARLAEVVALAAKGEVVMPVRAYPFEDVVWAHTAVDSARKGQGGAHDQFLRRGLAAPTRLLWDAAISGLPNSQP